MIGRLEAPGAKLEPVMPGFENRRSPSVALPERRSSSFLHDRDGRELIGDDGQHARLGRGGNGCGLWFCRRLPVLAGRRAGDPRGCARRHYRLSPHDRAWRRHGDFRQLRRGGRHRCVLRQCAVCHRA
jgi:hypothetical protein